MWQNSAAEKREGAETISSRSKLDFAVWQAAALGGDSVQDGCRHRVNPYCCRPCS